jgi:predicted lysophospholipase L1 biosynthesis ABC-type transport system permease subunit
VATETTDVAALPGPATGLGRSYPDDVVEGFGLSGESVPVRVVARAVALPGVGSEGSMADLQSSLPEFRPPPGALVGTRLWAAANTPPEVLAAVRRAGVPLSEPERLTTAVAELRGDAFMLGWRVFLLIGAGSLLLAVFGVVASSALQARWRGYEVASLRTVGVSRRTLVRAAVLEHAAVLGFAVALGVVASYVSSLLVVPALDLGRAGTYDPPPHPVTEVLPLLAIGGVALAVTLLVVVALSRRVVRRGTPASLRLADPA